MTSPYRAARMLAGPLSLDGGGEVVEWEISEASFDTLKPGDEIRLVQTTDAQITSFAPTTGGLPGRLCFGTVRGGPFDGTEQWQWVPASDTEAAAMKMRVFRRAAPPALGALRHHPSDGSSWVATSEPGLYACISPGAKYKLGSTEWRQNLGAMSDPRLTRRQR